MRDFREGKGKETDFYEEDIYEQEIQAEEALRILSFRLEDEWYGLGVNYVREMAQAVEITCLPSALEYVEGVINLRGNILAVVNLKKIFGIAAKSASIKAKLIVVEVNNLSVSFLADEIDEVIDVPLKKIEPVLGTIGQQEARYFKGEHSYKGRLLAILDAEKLFAKLENK